MIELTRKQERALSVIRAYIEGHGHGPSLDEIADELGTVRSNAWRYVRHLEAAGYLVRERTATGRSRTRTIRLVAPTPDPSPARPKAGGGRGESVSRETV